MQLQLCSCIYVCVYATEEEQHTLSESRSFVLSAGEGEGGSMIWSESDLAQ